MQSNTRGEVQPKNAVEVFLFSFTTITFKNSADTKFYKEHLHILEKMFYGFGWVLRDLNSNQLLKEKRKTVTCLRKTQRSKISDDCAFKFPMRSY